MANYAGNQSPGWHYVEEEKLLRMKYEEKLDNQTISIRLNRSVGAVVKRLRRLKEEKKNIAT